MRQHQGRTLALILILATFAAAAGAQSDLDFTTSQTCVIDSGTTTTYYVLTNNYAQSAYAWHGPFIAATVVPYNLPANEWLGLYIYNLDSGSYTTQQHNLRYVGTSGFSASSAQQGSDDLVIPLESLASSPSSSLSFSASSSLVNVYVGNSSAWMFATNYTTHAQSWTDLPMGASVATTLTLGTANQWVGAFLYDQVNGTWEDEAYYSIWNSLTPAFQSDKTDATIPDVPADKDTR